MIKFLKLDIHNKNNYKQNIKYIEEIFNLYLKHERFLNDDYTNKIDLLDEIIQTILKANPFFWVILKNNEFAGFVFLENVIGNTKHLHSGEITTCFKKEFWGSFTKKVAKKFVMYCFKKLKFKKLKAIVFKENFRVEALLKSAGFQLEATLKNETQKCGKPQDIKIYSVIRGKKNENK
ncbi:MAG: GNAT family N-acetyltransferase [Candidatus Gastranaerophilaceae bacterium]